MLWQTSPTAASAVKQHKCRVIDENDTSLEYRYIDENDTDVKLLAWESAEMRASRASRRLVFMYILVTVGYDGQATSPILLIYA